MGVSNRILDGVRSTPDKAGDACPVKRWHLVLTVCGTFFVCLACVTPPVFTLNGFVRLYWVHIIESSDLNRTFHAQSPIGTIRH